MHIMPPTVSSSKSQYNIDKLGQNYDRMGLDKHDPPPSPRECLVDLIQQVDHEHLREALQMELNRLLGDKEHLVTILQQRTRQLEQENEQLSCQAAEYQRRYDKAVREMQFFRLKYDRVLEQQAAKRLPSSDSSSTSSGNRSGEFDAALGPAAPATPTSPPPLPSAPLPSAPLPSAPLPSVPPFTRAMPPTPTYTFTPSEDPPRPRHPTAPAPTRSVSTSTTSSSTYYWGGPLPPVPSVGSALTPMPSRQGPPSIYSTSSDGMSQDARTAVQLRHNPSIHSTLSTPSTVYSASSAPSFATSAATSVYSVPMTPIRSTTSTNAFSGNSIIMQRRVDPLVFGGSEGLWDTIAKSQGNDATVEKTISNFLRRGGSPNTAKQSPSLGAVKYGYGMIHALIVTRAQGALDLLLQQGANPNAMTLSTIDEDKVSPCYIAASVGWLPGLQKLVQSGGDLVRARGHNGSKTVLHVAAEHCHVAVVEFVVSYTQGALNQVVDNDGATALHYAAQSGHAYLVNFLARSCQIPTNQATNKGEQPIHWATRAGSLETVTLLIEQWGCDVNAYVSKKVPTPLDLAKSGGHKKLVEYLKGAGGLTAKKMDKRRDEELAKRAPRHLESTLARNGLFGIGEEDGPF